MGAGRDRVAGVAKGIAECHFDRGHVRLYGGRRSARADVDCVSSNFLARGCAGAQLRLTANMLDGMVALASGRASKVGELYNEVPDRVSDAAVFIGAGLAWGETSCSVTSQRFWQSSLLTFTRQEKLPGRLTSGSAGRWLNNTGCW